MDPIIRHVPLTSYVKVEGTAALEVDVVEVVVGGAEDVVEVVGGAEDELVVGGTDELVVEEVEVVGGETLLVEVTGAVLVVEVVLALPDKAA